MFRPLCITLLIVATPAMAQEYDAQTHSDAMASAGQLATMESMRGQSRTNARGKAPISASARATCAGKQRAAARMGRDDPKVRRLYRLCAQAGY